MAGSTGKTKGARRKASTGRTAKAGLGIVPIGAALVAVAAGAFALLRLRRPASSEHVPTDLMGDTHPGPNHRAPVDFRPDPTAPVPEGERDAFRPALAGATAPTLVKGEAREHERVDAAPS